MLDIFNTTTTMQLITPFRWAGYCLQLLIPLAQIAILNRELWNLTVYSTANKVAIHMQCYLQSAGEISVCYSVYGVNVVSLVVSMTTVLVVLCIGNRRNTCVFRMIASSFLAVLWMAGASVSTTYIVGANNSGVPQANWRNALLGLMWSQAFVCLCVLVAETISCRSMRSLPKCPTQDVPNHNPQVSLEMAPTHTQPFPPPYGYRPNSFEYHGNQPPYPIDPSTFKPRYDTDEDKETQGVTLV